MSAAVSRVFRFLSGVAERSDCVRSSTWRVYKLVDLRVVKKHVQFCLCKGEWMCSFCNLAVTSMPVLVLVPVLIWFLLPVTTVSMAESSGGEVGSLTPENLAGAFL